MGRGFIFPFVVSCKTGAPLPVTNKGLLLFCSVQCASLAVVGYFECSSNIYGSGIGHW